MNGSILERMDLIIDEWKDSRRNEWKDSRNKIIDEWINKEFDSKMDY